MSRKQKSKQTQKKRNGRPSGFHDLTYQDISQVRWLSAQGLTHEEIAEHFKISDRTLRRWRNRDDKISFDLNSAIVTGQLLYEKPTANITLCLLEEVDRWDHEWRINVSIPHKIDLHNYLSVERKDELNELYRTHCSSFDSKSSSEESKMFGLILELDGILEHLRNLHHLELQIHKHNSWNRFTKKEPLRWDLLKSYSAKIRARIKINKKKSKEGADKTS